MDVKLTDGTVIKNVPEGTTQSQLMARLGKLDLQGMQGAALNREQLRQQHESDAIGRGASEFAEESVLPEWLAGKPSATYAQRVAAAPGTRFAVGAAAPFIGAAQLGANAIGQGDGINNLLQSGEEMKRAGGADGFDAMGMAGSVLSPPGLAAINALKIPKTIGGKIAQGGAMGAAFGATAPVTNGGSYWDEKGNQIAIGAGVGAGMPVALGAATHVAGPAIRHVYRGAIEPFFQGGRNAAAGRNYLTVSGERAQELADAMRVEPSFVPGYRSTASERIAVLPTSSTKSGQQELAGLQKNVAPSSSAIVDVEQGQGIALANRLRAISTKEGFDNPVIPSIQAAELERDAVTGPMREIALSNANVAGVKGAQLAERLQGQNNAVVNALQDKGRFQTFGAQQENLAHGGNAQRTGPQILSEKTGNLSPSAYPVSGYPRIPGRYTSNMDRVQEGISAADDTAQILTNRKAQEGLTQYQLDSLAAHGHYPLESKSIISAIDGLAGTPSNAPVSLYQDVLTAVRDKIAAHSKNGVIDSRSLYAIRKSEINDVIDRLTANQGTSTKDRAASLVASIKSDIDNAIEAAGGSGWKDYLKIYAEKSRNIDQMKIGQSLVDKLVNPLKEGESRAGVYAASLRDAAGIAKKSSGDPRYKSLDEALTPENRLITRDVERTLKNEAQSSVLGTAGTKRASELVGTPDIQIPPSPSRTGLVLRFAARLIQGKGTSAIDRQMANELLTNPSLVSDRIEKAMQNANTNAERVRILRQYQPLLTQGIATQQGQQE